MFKEVKNDEGEQTALLRSFFHFFIQQMGYFTNTFLLVPSE